jgi:subtilisin-like proprotein convertase family protein
VTAPSGPQNYGVLPSDGSEVIRSFTFTVSASCGGAVAPTFSITNNGQPLSDVAFNFVAGEISVSNGASINTSFTIPTSGAASPYPGNLVVSGVPGTITGLTVSVNGLSHTWPSDIDMLLVAPGGQKVMLLSDAGGGTAISNVNLTFSDAAAANVTGALTSGTFKPTNLGGTDTMPAGPPAGANGATLSLFNGLNPNGTWQLYVADDEAPDSGSISGGWSMNITTKTVSCCVLSGNTLAINDVVVTEGQSGTANANLTVTLTRGNSGVVTVNYATSDGSALAPGDYTSTSSSLSFAAGETTKQISVPVVGDALSEIDETFSVTLSNPSGATITDDTGTVTIDDNDAAVSPQSLVIDAAGNGVFEAGETVVIAPSWKNIGAQSVTLTGLLSNFTGPASATYSVTTSGATYGAVLPDATNACSSCYGASISSVNRPATHWDATATETLSNGTAKQWTLHVGDSFTDVPRSNIFYANVEALLHGSVTQGCGVGLYCPTATVVRDQMAAFIARAMAGSDAAVPLSATAQSQPYNCIGGGISLFPDVQPTDGFCKHIHYIYARSITAGCVDGYCPTQATTRGQMAAFIARALVSPAGDGAIPMSYTDPTSGLSYNCGDSTANHFPDVPDSDAFCRQIHFIWARQIVGGGGDGLYHSLDAVVRDTMAKFLANAFQLKLYKP